MVTEKIMTEDQNKFQNSHLDPDSLHRLVVLRSLAIVLQVITLLVAVFYLHQTLPLVPIIAVIILYAGLTLYTWRHVKQVEVVDCNEYFFHLLADITVLTALLYFSGGATNPFVLVYLLPITIAIVLLSTRTIWWLAAITAFCYTLLLWKHVPLEMAHGHASHDEFNIHIIGMWFSFVITAILISYFVVGMRNTLQQQQAALSEAREQVMRDEQLVALGTLAASTAHELGTPLSTMALLLEELDAPDVTDEQKRENITVMRGQVTRCRDALTTLSLSAGGIRLVGGAAVSLRQYMQDLCEECEATRPGKLLSLSWLTKGEAPTIVIDRSISQALANIIDNAQKLSNKETEIHALWCSKNIELTVSDRGPGIPDAIQSLMGKEPIAIDSSGSDGLGLGLFLAYSVIRRFNGKVNMVNRSGGGSITTIILPLENLQA